MATATATAAIAMPTRQLFINGDWREPINGKHIPIINPATEETIGHIPAATTEDVNVAVEAARKAFFHNGGKDWSSAPGAYRAKFLRAIAAKIKERKPELITLEAIDCGRSLEEVAWDMSSCISANGSIQVSCSKRTHWCSGFNHTMELSSVNGNMESCPCPSSWMYCHTQTF